MDDAPHNPFLSIDKKRFPKSKDEKKSAPQTGASQRPAASPRPGQTSGAPTGKATGKVSGKGQAPAPVMPDPRPVEDEELFASAMSGVKPIGGSAGRTGEAVPAPAPLKPAAEQRNEEEELQVHSQLLDLVSGKIEFSLEHTEEYIKGCVVGLDAKTFSRLKTGWYPPEAHLDLHGQSAAQAADALLAFMRDSYLNNRRCVLLIPGRGKNSPEGYGVLRERIQAWLTRDPCKRVVLAFCTAQPRHGGAGALYVLLRKRKGEGKIRWDRIAVEPENLP